MAWRTQRGLSLSRRIVVYVYEACLVVVNYEDRMTNLRPLSFGGEGPVHVQRLLLHHSVEVFTRSLCISHCWGILRITCE